MYKPLFIYPHCLCFYVGSELTFNYNLVSVGETKLKCLCKAPSCTGFIGERKTKVGVITMINPLNIGRGLVANCLEIMLGCRGHQKLLSYNTTNAQSNSKIL